jgi:hypothetical protein
MMTDVELMENYREEKDNYINELTEFHLNFLSVVMMLELAEKQLKYEYSKKSFSEVKREYNATIGV